VKRGEQLLDGAVEGQGIKLNMAGYNKAQDGPRQGVVGEDFSYTGEKMSLRLVKEWTPTGVLL